MENEVLVHMSVNRNIFMWHALLKIRYISRD